MATLGFGIWGINRFCVNSLFSLKKGVVIFLPQKIGEKINYTLKSYGLCHNHSSLRLWPKSQYVSWTICSWKGWLCSSKILFTKTGNLWICPHDYCLLVSALHLFNYWVERREGEKRRPRLNRHWDIRWPPQELQEVNEKVGKFHSFLLAQGWPQAKL